MISLSRWRARIAWLVILLLVSLVVYLNARANRLRPLEAEVEDIRIRVMAQELIGIKSLAALAGPAQPANLKESQQLMISQLEASIQSQADRLHVAIIVGEVLGPEKALAQLEVLGPAAGELARDIAALRAIYASNPSALDAESQSRLVRRHGYFGQVALAYAVPREAEPRKSLESAGVRATVMLGLIGMFFLLLVLGGFGFFIAALVLRARGKLQCAYRPDPGVGSLYLEGFAIYLVLFILAFGLVRRYFGIVNMQWEWLALAIIPIVLFWIGWHGVSFSEQLRALGWQRGKGVLREIGAGFAGYLAGIVVMIAGFVVTYLLMKQTGMKPEHPLIHMLQGNRWHVLGLYLLVSVFAPVMEETMFRGALFHHLRSRWGWAVSAPIVALIFAIIHPQGWVAVPVLGSIAIVLAALREWRGSLIAPMVAHALNNFVVLTIALATFR